MGSTPTINIVSLIHLAFVAAFIGLYLCETVIETYAYYRNDFHPSAIRYHYLMDLAVEIPLISGILVTGIILAVLIGRFSGLHIALIACGSLTALYCPFTFFRWVRTRNRELNKEKPDEQYLIDKRKEMIVATTLVFQPALLASLIIGVWLAYHRMLESVQG